MVQRACWATEDVSELNRARGPSGGVDASASKIGAQSIAELNSRSTPLANSLFLASQKARKESECSRPDLVKSTNQPCPLLAHTNAVNPALCTLSPSLLPINSLTSSTIFSLVSPSTCAPSTSGYTPPTCATEVKAEWKTTRMASRCCRARGCSMRMSCMRADICEWMTVSEK